MQKSQSIHLFGLLGCESRNQRWWIGCFEFRDQRSVVLVIMSILRRDAAATMSTRARRHSHNVNTRETSRPQHRRDLQNFTAFAPASNGIAANRKLDQKLQYRFAGRKATKNCQVRAVSPSLADDSCDVCVLAMPFDFDEESVIPIHFATWTFFNVGQINLVTLEDT